jgi:hypothetical protein
MAVVCPERSKATALADVITWCVFVGTIALVSFRVIRKDYGPEVVLSAIEIERCSSSWPLPVFRNE